MARSFGTKTFFALVLGLLFVALSVVVVVLVNMTMRRLALSDAEHAARMLLDHNLAIHTYFSQDLKPKLFDKLGPITSKDYFEPVWMSSTYAIREIDRYFRHFNQSPYYYKECAINARSPENEADNYEKAFLVDLQDNPQLTAKSAIRVLDGKPYFTLLRRGEAMEESCLRCHSSPEKAPGELVRHYGPERSFHRKVDEVVQAISIRIPLSEAFSSTTGFSYFLSGLLLVALGGGFLFVWVGNKRVVIDPISRVREHALHITSDRDRLGETIPEPKVRELRDLVVAFNQMSAALKKSYEELEQRVLERTEDLAAANQQLEKEIELRGQAQREFERSEQELRLTLAATTDGIWKWNFQTNQLFFSEKYYTMLGYQPDEFPALYDNWAALIHPDDRDSCLAVAEKYLATKPDLYENEFRLRTKDGQYRWMHSRAHVVERDDNGEAVRMIGNHEDITERKNAEQALKQSQQMLLVALEGANLGMWDWDLTTGKAIWSERSHRMLGYEPTEFEPNLKNWKKLVHPDDWPRVSENLNLHIRGRLPLFEVENRIRNKSEDWQWVKAEGRVIEFDSGGKPTRMAGVVADITERKRSEEALRESEERYRLLLRNANDAIYVHEISPEGPGRFLDANDRARKMLGYSREEFLAMTVVDVDVPEQLARVPGIIERLYATGGAVFETEHLTKDGRRIPVEVSTRLFNIRGQSTVLSVVRDITERKRAQEDLRASEANYRTLFEESLHPIFITDADGTLIDANQAYFNLFGYTRGEIIGESVIKTYADPEDRATYRMEIHRKGFVKDYPVKLRTKDGRDLDCLISARVRKDGEGTSVGYRGFIRDVTEQKTLERQLIQAQKMEAIGTLAGGVAHDFNNLLQVVLGYSDLLLADENTPHQMRGDLNNVLSAARRGADLVQRLLTFSRRKETRPRPIRLDRALEQVSQLLARTIPKMIEIRLLPAGDTSPINADSTQIEQIMLNLAVNARDAMPQGGSLIIKTENATLDEEYCKTHAGSKPGPYVLLTVSDTGSGMDEETLEHIFEPFYTTKGPGEGTGLGLAMVYGIVRQHGGYITCTSTPGKGTTFKIYFPALVSDKEEERAPVEVLPRGGTETILLVDDEELIRDIAERNLQRAGYSVLTASNGREALEIYRRERDKIALVILDFIMPEMGGMECLEELLEINAKIKVVVASGQSMNGQAKKDLEQRVRGFVGKPYDMQQVLVIVRDVLDSPRI